MPLLVRLFFALLLGAFLTGCAAWKDSPEKDEMSSGLTNKESSTFVDPDSAFLAELFPKVKTADEAIHLGDQAYSQGKKDLALLHYVRAFDMDNAHVEALEKMSLIYTQKGDHKLSDLANQMIIKHHPDNVSANESLGLSRLNSKQYDAAEAYLNRAIKLDPKRWASHNGLGVIADIQHDYPRAISHYQAALALMPNSPALLNNIGYSFYLSGNYDKAPEYFNQALNVDPDYAPAIKNMGLLEARKRNYEKAVDILTRVMKSESANNDVGYIAMLNGDYRIAEQLFLRAIQGANTYYPKANENLEQLRKTMHSGAP